MSHETSMPKFFTLTPAMTNEISAIAEVLAIEEVQYYFSEQPLNTLGTRLQYTVDPEQGVSKYVTIPEDFKDTPISYLSIPVSPESVVRIKQVQAGVGDLLRLTGPLTCVLKLIQLHVSDLKIPENPKRRPRASQESIEKVDAPLQAEALCKTCVRSINPGTDIPCYLKTEDFKCYMEKVYSLIPQKRSKKKG